MLQLNMGRKDQERKGKKKIKGKDIIKSSSSSNNNNKDGNNNNNN